MPLLLVPLNEKEAAQLADWAAKQEDTPFPRFFERLGEVAAQVKASPAGNTPAIIATPGTWQLIMETALMHGVPGTEVVKPSEKDDG